ncbi:MAG: sulfite exporter TauE/SafE family protein [Alphaproteobacteria bacterium]|nr:sulfite exporter TauE/SafE family protein [Alphaproteobacteria bacterium]MBV8408402.1 sulfite exporter TauE/SafE family protein [Alphaproteobacteria bacterium]
MQLGAQLSTHAVFLVFVALAVYAQALTGFALALILLGLIGATNLMPLTDAVNATTTVGFCTAWTFLYRRRALRIERVLVPTLVASAAGIMAGALVLVWLADTAYQVLRLVLGLSIVACALSLWHAARPLPSLSSPAAYALTGGIAGLMAGMFSAPGPPLVYLLYRQPKPMAWIQESLMVIFGLGTTLRLLILVPSGQFSLLSLQLAVEALPVVFVVTSYAARRRTPPLSPKLFRGLICALLIGTGFSLVTSAFLSLR